MVLNLIRKILSTIRAREREREKTFAFSGNVQGDERRKEGTIGEAKDASLRMRADGEPIEGFPI